MAFEGLKILWLIVTLPFEKDEPELQQAYQKPNPDAWKSKADKWDIYDEAALKIFRRLGAENPEAKIERYDYFKSVAKLWHVEMDVDELMLKMEDPDFPPTLKSILQQTIDLFWETLDDEKHSDFRQKSNHFTLAYRYKQEGENGGRQSHELSIGCPLNPEQRGEKPPRFYLRFEKDATLQHPAHCGNTDNRLVFNQNNATGTGSEKVDATKEYESKTGSFTSFAPAPFLGITTQFCRYVINAYGDTPDEQYDVSSGPGFVVRDIYGYPSAVLDKI